MPKLILYEVELDACTVTVVMRSENWYYWDTYFNWSNLTKNSKSRWLS